MMNPHRTTVTKRKKAPIAKKSSSSSSSASSSEEDSNSDSSDSSDDEETPKVPLKRKVSSDSSSSTTSFSEAAVPSKKQKVEVKVFVKGLPLGATEEELQEFFSSCGDGPTRVVINRDHLGRSFGNALLYFSSQLDADEALAVDKCEFQSRRLDIKQYVPPETPKQEGTCTVFLGNLDHNIDE